MMLPPSSSKGVQREDVKVNAEDIYKVVLGGTMPCDGAWPADKVRRFESWKDGGQLP